MTTSLAQNLPHVIYGEMEPQGRGQGSLFLERKLLLGNRTFPSGKELLISEILLGPMLVCRVGIFSG